MFPESAGCHTVVTQMRRHLTINGSVDSSCDLLACFRNPKGGPKLSMSEVKITAIGWIFMQLKGRTHFRESQDKTAKFDQGQVSNFTFKVFSTLSDNFGKYT